jgi:chemosensory pili system protein ChpA (sensor histidine kinase/response regulator)
MHEAIDYNALNWVRKELGETLKQSRLHFEEYAGNKDRADALHDCAALLHQARGPLKMLELNGADLLAAEMEEVVSELLNGEVSGSEAVREVLMQAFLQLPDYLSRLCAGKQDAPAILLPVINSLRTVRGIKPLQEATVFSPDLTVHIPTSVFNLPAARTEQDIQDVARSVRVRFQAGLLEWYRGNDAGSGLATLRTVLEELQKNATREPVARLWWASAGLAEALVAGALAASPAVKQLFGQIDRQIKRLMDSGEEIFSDALSDDLLKSLLYQLAHADLSSGRVGEIKATFGLDELLVSGVDAAMTDDCLGGYSEDLLQTVAVTVRGEIEQIKNQIDIFTRGTRTEIESLEPVADGMHALGNTLVMVGMDRLGQTVSDQEQVIRDYLAGTCNPDDAEFMVMANTLVAAEDALDSVISDNEGMLASESSDDVAYLQGIDTVIREVISDMSRLKDVFNDFIKTPDDYETLHVVPALLRQVSGGLQLAGQDRAAEASQQLQQFVSCELIEKRRVLDEGKFDTLADAICSIEYYVEELTKNRVYGGMVLDVAEKSLVELGYPCATSADDYAGNRMPHDQGTQNTPATGAQGSSSAPVDEVTAGEVNALSDQPDREETLNIPEAVAVDVPVITDLQVVAADADEEILEIFIEEADEELGKLSELLPAWAASPETTAPLAEAKRSFHTLKGSGRMVGALAVGEFSWVFERFLSQIMDGQVNVNEEIPGLVCQSTTALLELMSQVKDSAVSLQSDVNGIVRQVVMLGCPEVKELLPAVNHDSSVEDVVEQSAPEDAVLEESPEDGFPVLAAEADPEVVEIFLEEAANELATLAKAIPGWISQPGNKEALGVIQRSLHTLKGSGRMAGAMMVGEFACAIESLLNLLVDGSIQAGDSFFHLLEQVPVSLSGLLEQIKGGPGPSVDIQRMMEQASALGHGEIIETDLTDAVADIEEMYGPALGEEDGEYPELAGEMTIVESESADELALIEIFCKECKGHLDVIWGFVNAGPDPREVSEPLYRALHTISGISESAKIHSIKSLAGDLDVYFNRLYQDRGLVCSDAIDVLGDCALEINRLVDQLPMASPDEELLATLRVRISELPDTDELPDVEPSEEKLAADGESGDSVSAVDSVTAEVQESGQSQEDDPYVTMDPELFEVFVEEASEIIEGGEATLQAWESEPDNSGHMAEFQRQLHTLKGGARMVDIVAIGDLSHALETLLSRVADGHMGTSGNLFALLRESQDRLADMLDRVKARELPESAGDLENVLNALESNEDTAIVDAVVEDMAESAIEQSVQDKPGSEGEAGSESESEFESEPVVEAMIEPEAGADIQEEVPVDTAVTEQEEHVEHQEETEVVARTVVPASSSVSGNEVEVLPAQLEHRSVPRLRGEQVRVQAGLLDNMVNYAGEINIYRSRMEQQVSDYRFNLAELDQTTSRLRDQLRKLEMETEAQILFRHEHEFSGHNKDFDPLEMDRYSNLQQLSRSLLESISDLRSIQELMENTTRQSESLLLQQSLVSTDLQEGLMRTRMVPFSGLAPRLRRIVRQSSGQLKKKVELNLEGSEGEMDRTVINRIIAPVEHMLRNAVAHGIEMPEDRKKAGKPASGTVRISFDREGSEIVLRIADDGAGMDVDAIRSRAIERNLLAEDAEISDGDVIQFVLQTGFSTASEVTQISGRGVGMDVVSSEVRQLGGILRIDSSPGKGTVLTMRLPYTLAINQALLVKAGEQTFCIPLDGIEGIVRANPEELAACYASEDCMYEHAGSRYHLKHLGTLLDTGGVDMETGQFRVPVLLARIGEECVALQVESLFGSREIVIKPVGAQLCSIDGISGATILGDGSVVMILDLASVSRMTARVQFPKITREHEQETHLVVMVVDDSITVRKVTTRLLERNGFKVLTAKDGVDAMGQLQDVIPDIMLLDIEMPRMDGFELATHMRNDEGLKHVPIIMITSRTGDKHREHAREIGVNNYLGKPYQENDLLESIHRLIGVQSSETAA